MQNVFKSLLVVLSLLVFSFELSYAESKYNARQVIDDNLPKNYTWYVVTDKKPAVGLLQGNLRKTYQIFTEKQGEVTVVIENYSDGGSAFYIIFNDIDKDRVKITFDKNTVANFLKGVDPRKDYEEDIKFLVLNNILYFGMLKSSFAQ